MPLPTAYGTIPLGGALPEAYIPVDSVPLLGGALESGYGEVSYAVNMTAAASGSNGITVADDDDIDFGTGDFAISAIFAYQQGVATTKAEENLLTYSQQFDNAAWAGNGLRLTITANSTTAPDNTTTADSFTGLATTNDLLYSSLSLTGGVNYTVSFFIKNDTANYAYFSLRRTTSVYAAIEIDLATGTVNRTSNSGITIVSSSVAASTQGFYRCVLTVTTASSASHTVYVGLSDGSSAFDSNGRITSDRTGLTAYFWGAQVEQRSSVTAYTATTSAAITKNVYWLALKYQDGSNYWGYRVSSTGLLEFIAAVGGLIKINVQSTAAITSTNEQIIEATATCSRESSGTAGSAAFYVNGTQLGAAVSISAASPSSLSNSGSLYIMGSDSVRNLSRVIQAIVMNFAPAASEVLDLCVNGIPASWKWGSQTAQTSGTLTVGNMYRINAYAAGDDFTNVGAASNASGVRFTATGTTPTAWTNSSSLVRIGATMALLPDTIPTSSATKWSDTSGNTGGGTLPAAGATKITIRR